MILSARNKMRAAADTNRGVIRMNKNSGKSTAIALRAFAFTMLCFALIAVGYFGAALIDRITAL